MANVIGTNHWDPENKWISISIPPANPGQTKPASATIEVKSKNGNPQSTVSCTNPEKSWSSPAAAVTWNLDGATQPAGAPPPPAPPPTTSTVSEANTTATGSDKVTPSVVVSGTKTTYTYASSLTNGAETQITVTMIESGGGL